MIAIAIILATIVVMVLGYIFYGSWLAKQWGVDPNRKTPAVELEDGVDYVPAKPAVLMGHHFSSIAGAGPINGPIQASVFGWLPVCLWCVFGSIFFGGVHDFGSMLASIRHDGKSLGEVVKTTMGERAKKLFNLFLLLVLLLVIASFVNVVAGTFSSANTGFTASPTGQESTSMVSVLFIVLAMIYGVITSRLGLKTGPATILGILGIVAITAIGLNVGLAMSRATWIILIGVYITVASMAPVWILLQPRDYLSSFLLYAIMGLALVGIFFSAFANTTTFDIPMFTSWSTSRGTLFPALFITVACGACSGFHSGVATGTSSKQLASERSAKPIAYGSMLIEGTLAVMALIAVGMVYNQYTAGEFGSPAAAFAAGIAGMFDTSASRVYNVVYALITLGVSVFALTTLDTGTRLSRYVFSELFLKKGEITWKDVKSPRKFLAHPLTGTLIMVIVGCVLGALELSEIWALFGAANQLLAALGLITVAAWLGNIGKNNKMFYIPMAFMLAATLTSLIITIYERVQAIVAGGVAWGAWFQLILAAVMVTLAIILVVESIQALATGKKKAGSSQV